MGVSLPASGRRPCDRTVVFGVFWYESPGPNEFEPATRLERENALTGALRSVCRDTVR